MKLHSRAPSRAHGKFADARHAMSAALVERGDEIDLVLTALVCREHPLLVGPPGCAKSMLLDSLMSWMGGRRFTALLTKYTVPEELFGPVSLSGLKEDRFVRVTSGRLPEADGCFLDEVFKASSAILNTLLRILNERTFDAGDGVAKPVPLRICVAASNEFPNEGEGGRELNALWDRFLLRKVVRPVATAAGRDRLLWSDIRPPEFAGHVTPDELDEAHDEATSLPWSPDGKEALEAVLRELAREGIRPGDRRQRKSVMAARSYAWLCGADEVRPEHLEILQHCLWDDPGEQPLKCAQVIAKVANPPGMRVSGLLMECEEVLAGVEPRDLAKAATATAKLSEIDRKLSALGKDARAEKARAHVKEQIRRLKLASIEAV
jgi:MoxR-like ATPase